MLRSFVKICKYCGPISLQQAWYERNEKKYLCRKCLKEKYERDKFLGKFKSPKIVEYKKRFNAVERPADTKFMRCCTCKKELCISLFSKCMIKTRYPYCKACHRERYLRTRKPQEKKIKIERTSQEIYKIQWERNGSRMVNARLLKKYGISLAQYNEKLSLQNYLCAICQTSMRNFLTKTGKIRRLAVDHCHSTGAFRGLLCNSCNTGLGNFKENSELFMRAIAYLQEHKRT